eukprot:364892-Chlamydomonas_euryale.AAC.7
MYLLLAQEGSICVLLDPGVLLDIRQVEAVFWVLNEQLSDEVLCVLADGLVVWEQEVNADNPAVCILMVVRLEGRHTKQELVRKDAKAPVVNALVVLKALNHLGRQVVQCATQRAPAAVWRMHRPAKVSNLQFS